MGGTFSRIQNRSASTTTQNVDNSRPTASVQPTALQVPVSIVLPEESTAISPEPHPVPPPPIDRGPPFEEAFAPLSLGGNKPGILLYTLSVSDQRVCFFIPSTLNLIDISRSKVSLPRLDDHSLYIVSAITLNYLGKFTKPRELRMYTARNSFVCGSLDAYLELILPTLLLGCRVRDYEQRCATATQLGEEMVLNMPTPFRRPRTLKLKPIGGEPFDVAVRSVQNEEERRWIVTCLFTAPLHSSVCKGCLLEIVSEGADQSQQSPVTGALLQFHCIKRTAVPFGNWTLLDCIYGQPAHRVFPAVIPLNRVIQLANNGGQVYLNAAQAEAVALYNSSSVPAFVIEAPPGSGKTLTAAAMAVAYEGKGVQLFLSTANVPVVNIAQKLAEMDFGSRSPVHLISVEYEDKMTEETRSPFSSLSLARNLESLRKKIEEKENDLKFAPNEEERKKVRQEIRDACGPVLDEKHDIYFATLDTILNRLFKPNKGGRLRVDTVKNQLQKRVERVVVDESSQLTEAALNALILCFPKAQIVLIGDSNQLPPFKCQSGEIVSELASRSALDVIKDKKNIPVIKLREVYRASQSLIAHYSDVFYDGRLVSRKENQMKNPFKCIKWRTGDDSRCIFWKVNNGTSITPKDSTSKINHRELVSLQWLIKQLKTSGIEEKDVMIICYYEGQRKKAEEWLPGYEVLTVDSAQGREKNVVIVLTTRSSVSADAGEDFLNSPKRCNVAISRHKEALIFLGHPSIASAPNWAQVLSPKYFKHIEDNGGSR